MTDDKQNTDETTALARLEPPSDTPLTPFNSMRAFEEAQRVAKALMISDMVPDIYRGNIGNVLIAMELANRTGSSIMAVMQNLNLIHGKPSWSASYCIAAINQSRRFLEPLSYEFVGTERRDDWGCRAVTRTKSGDVIKGPLVTVAMAKQEGWWNRKNSKWPTMTELMLTYRAAAFFARTKTPEILMGMLTTEEVREVGPAIIADDTLSETSLTDLLHKTPLETGAHTVVEPDPEDIIWPQWDGERKQWFDKTGEYYDPHIHADYEDGKTPHVNKDDTFRRRRGATKRLASASDGKIQPGAVGTAADREGESGAGNQPDDGAKDAFQTIKKRIESAESMADLDLVEVMIEERLDGAERGEANEMLGARYRTLRAENRL